MRHVYIRPLLPDVELAVRQARIARGLLEAGVGWDEIRALQWYDVRLEELVNNPVNTVNTPVNTDMNTDPDPTDVRHGGDPEENRKAYRRKWMAERRAAAKKET